MAKTPTEAPEPADKRRFVNRNPHLQAAARIVDILHEFDPTKRLAILRTVNDVLGEQPELEFMPPEQH